VPLDDVKAVKNALGATLNDVVMAVCAGALRTYLQSHDALPDAPLVAMVPVSIRTGDEDDRWTNRVSGLLAPLPTNVADPVERVRVVHEAMLAAKERFELIPADVLTDFARFSPPALATRAARMASRLRIAVDGTAIKRRSCSTIRWPSPPGNVSEKPISSGPSGPSMNGTEQTSEPAAAAAGATVFSAARSARRRGRAGSAWSRSSQPGSRPTMRRCGSTGAERTAASRTRRAWRDPRLG
jgi:WS/DGAT C-terminal domain